MRTAKAVANYFLSMPEVRDEGIDPLKLQKLVYIAHGWHLALTDGIPLVQDEKVEAWRYGPVFPSLYHEFKHFGSGRVSRKATELVAAKKGMKFRLDEPVLDREDQQTRKLLNKIWDVYGEFSGVYLSEMTHAEGTPWHKVRDIGGCPRNAHIENDDIKRHYQNRMKSRRSK